MRMFWAMVLMIGGLLGSMASTAAAKDPVLLVLGDSLSAGYGIDTTDAWPSLLQARLAARQWPHRVVNASISGETTAGGLARLPALLASHAPHVLVLELGANDGLRGLPLETIADNLKALVKLGREAGARVVVIPMRIPPNYGPLYSDGFDALFAELPRRAAGVSLSPFFLRDVALDPALLQADGLHPTAAAQPRMLDAVWPVIEAALHKSSE